MTRIAGAGEPIAEDENKWLLAGNVIKEQGGSTWTDLKSIVRAPFENPEQTAKWGLIVAGLVLVDKPVTQFYQEEVEPRLGWHLDSISPTFGGADGYLVYGLGAHYLGAALSGNEKGQHVSIMAGKAMAYSLVVSHLVLKPIFGRNRPSQDLASCPAVTPPYTCDPYDFGHHYTPTLDQIQSGSAMPSFHATMFFSVARVYQLSYDNYWIPYGLAALAWTSNIEGHKHWVSDMVAGAVIGTVIGTRVYNNSYKNKYRSEKKASRIIVPIVADGKLGVNVFYPL